MLETVHCIVLRMVKYSDNKSIATVWTRQRGRMSAVVPSGRGREAQRRRAIMMPLGVFEAVARTTAGTDIVSLSDVRPISSSPAAEGNPAMTVVTMFLADFLNGVLKESISDPNLSDYIFDSLSLLRTLRGTALANFHLAFAVHLGQFLGILPDVGSYTRSSYFDMREGLFTASQPMHSQHLDPRRAKVLALLLKMPLRSLHLLKLSRNERNEILDAILQYYTLHYAPLSNMASLGVIRDIFA